jgi:hypothetical protein
MKKHNVKVKILIGSIILLFMCIFITGLGCNDYFNNLNKNPYFEENVLSNKKRLEYYMGNLTKPTTLKRPNPKKTFFIISNTYIDNTDSIYIEEMMNYYNKIKNKKEIIVQIGDVTGALKVPVITKTRPLIYNKNVLLLLTIDRHWENVNKLNDIPYSQKNNKLIWRGASTGFKKRIPLVKKYYDNDNFDIGFSSLIQGQDTNENQKYLKDRITIDEMLKSKFLISIEGNDVATNLKWLMYSNSVCLKAPAIIVSWFMEDLLVPWYHYVPLLPDYSDLEEKYVWCLENPVNCQIIIKNANRYVEHFMNPENEEKLSIKVLERYTDLVTLSP